MNQLNRLKGQFLVPSKIKQHRDKTKATELPKINCKGFNSNGIIPRRRGQL